MLDNSFAIPSSTINYTDYIETGTQPDLWTWFKSLLPYLPAGRHEESHLTSLEISYPLCPTGQPCLLEPD
jgi:hypothetical protein